MRNLGVLGEATFKTLCTSVGLVANKSEQDEFGWDYIVEFPYEDNEKPLDMQQPIECKIQVKATDKQERKLAVKVSVLDRLVKSSNPAFIIFLEFDKQTEVQSIFLRHIDEEIIIKTLKRSRELAQKNKPLHKSTIQVDYEKYQLEDISGETIKKDIEKYLPNGLTQYVRYKQNLLETLGFDEGAEKISMIFKNTTQNDLIDMSLGLKDEPLEVAAIDSHTNTRFGIELNIENSIFLNAENAKISFKVKEPEKHNALMVLIDEDDKVLLKVNTKIITSPFGTKNQKKIKVDTDLFFFTVAQQNDSFILRKLELKFNYYTESPLLLSNIIKHFELQHHIETNSKNTYFKLLQNNKEIAKLKMNKGQIDPRTIVTYRVAKKLQKILEKIGVYHDISLQIDDLENNREVINLVYESLFGVLDDINISFSVEDMNLNKYNMTTYHPFILVLNNDIYGGWILLHGITKMIDGKYKLNITKSNFKKDSFDKENINSDLFEDKFQSFLNGEDSKKDGKIAMLNLNLMSSEDIL